MPPYAALVGAGFRRYSTYRAATLGGAVANSVFGVVTASVMVAAVSAGGGEIAGYDAVRAATYAWLAQAFLAPLAIFGSPELAERVRTGDVAVDLARPVDPQLAALAADLGRAAFMLLPRGLPPLAVGAALTGLALPAAVLPYLLGAASLALGVVVSFGCRWLVALSAFWLTETRGVLGTYVIAANLLSGLLITVAWFPPWLATVAGLTPFPSMLHTPVEIVSGTVVGTEALARVGVQLAWAAGLLALGQVVFRLGTRRLVVQGG